MKPFAGVLKICFLLPFVVVQSFLLHAQNVHVAVTSNTVDLKNPDQLFSIIGNNAQLTSEPLIWLLNGDVFPETITDEQTDNWLQNASRVLDAHPHLSIVVNQGEREWDDSKKTGWKSVRHLEEMTKLVRHPRLHFFLDNGCPGPWTLSISDELDVVAFNSQWWNHPYDKPLPYMNACGITDEDVFLEKVAELLDDSKNKSVILLTHFPLISFGKYGGRFPFSSHLLPPVLGSAVVSFRQNVGTTDDIINVNFDSFRTKMMNLLEDYANVAVVSGHEKNHSIIKDGNNFHINSGALEDANYVARSKQAHLTSGDPGFIELTSSRKDGVRYKFYKVHGDVQVISGEGALINPITENLPMAPATTPQNVIASDGTTTRVIAGPEYENGKWGKFWFGKHYRSSWTTEIKVPVLNLDTTFRGLTVTRKGGGRQTSSLKLIGGNGKEYVFRSVNKDPSRALHRSMRGTLVSQIVKDQTSTQQPYGALTASYLLDQLSILHARPRLYVLPADDKLGNFRDQYGNLLGMLEDSPSDKIAKENIFGGAGSIERSHKLFQKLFEDHDNHVDRLEFCRARVFDLWVGDWGKHEDNWKWAGYKRDGGNIYRPIPRDRDHVFSRWDGAIPYLADREWAKETGEDFGYKIKGLRSLMQQARHMDRLLGNQLTKNDWVNAAKDIQRIISPSVVEEAVRQMPREIRDPDGNEIEAKLKSRLKDLPQYAEAYYRMLAKEVDVVGSNKAEYFLATRNRDGTVDVNVYDVGKGRKPDFSKSFYTRKFLPSETKEIRLYGLTNNDVFVIRGESQTSILIRIIPGDRSDDVFDSSSVAHGPRKTLIYQEGRGGRFIGKEGKIITPKNKNLYHYQRTGYAYNTYFPFALITYNPFTGLTFNTRVAFTNHHFSKPDFSTRHVLSGSVSVNQNYELSYRNQFRYLIGKWDGISEINLSRPLNYNYFFGVGNNTSMTDGADKNYYRAQYNSFLVNAGITRMFWKQSQITFLAGFESDEGIARAESFLSDNPDALSMQHLQMISAKTMLNLDFRDDRFLPQRGFRLNLEQELIHLDNEGGDMASRSLLEIEHYLSTRTRNPLTLGLRSGGGVTTGKLPFYKLFSLGQLNDLHGFKRNRFTGEAKAYLNTELRWQVLETRNRFIPVKAGLRAFFDIGRVWADDDADDADFWHKGYGGGFYVTPFTNQFSVNVSFGASKEEPFLFMFGIGGFLK